MKKTFLLIMAVALCTSLMAQHKVKISKHQAVPYDKTYSYGAGQNEDYDVIPNVSQTILQSKGGDNLTYIGETYYILATNAFARNTVSFKPGTNNAAAVWTTATTSSATRGTGINYYNGSNKDWRVAPNADARIESARTGWGTHGFTAEGEIVVSHSAPLVPNPEVPDGLYVNIREKWGQGDWTEYILQGPEYTMETGLTTGLVWPTMVTRGDVVHIVCVTEQYTNNNVKQCAVPYGYQPEGSPCPMPTVPLYYRSKDGGKTWDIKAHDFRSEGMTDFEMQCTSGDNYSLAIKGDHIVFLYAPNGSLFYMESKDGGDTWHKVTVYDNDTWYWDDPSDIMRLSPNTAHACIDDNHKVHVVFSSHCCHKTEEGFMYYPNIPIGLIYWNEDRGPIDWEDVKCWVGEDDYLDWNWEEYPDYIALPSVLGFDQFYFWEGTPSLIWDQYRSNGWAAYPRIVAKKNAEGIEKVYVSYQAPLEYPLIFNPVEDPNFYRGIFVTVSMDGGETWDVPNNTSWASYHDQLFFCDWSKYEGPEYLPNGDPTWDGKIEVGWGTENGFPTMSYNNFGQNFILQWYNDFKPLCIDDNVFQYDPINMYALVLSLEDFPTYGNISEVWQGLWQDISKFESAGPGEDVRVVEPKSAIKAEIYPNPATEGTVYVVVDAHSAYTITVTNVMGQVVQTVKGNSPKTALNVSNLSAGVYIVNIKTNTATTSQKLIVK